MNGHWFREPTDNPEWLLYLPYVNGPSLLRQALASVSEHAGRVVVIDQSATGEAATIHAGPVVRWTTEPHFSAVQNAIQRDAYARSLRWFLFMHADAEASVGGVQALCDEAARLDRGDDRWGVIFTNYDALCLFNPRATAAVGPWDELFRWYVADIDYYNRLRWEGWRHCELAGACAVHHTSQTLAGMSDMDRRRVTSDQVEAVAYYRRKWGCHWEEAGCKPTSLSE